MTDIRPELSQCTLCADRFAATATGHRPNPVVWFQPGARLLIASQAPGLKVHEANTPLLGCLWQTAARLAGRGRDDLL